MMRTAAALAWAAGLGFGLPCIYAIWYLADRGDVWTFLGFPTYGGGPFEDVGIETTVPLLVVFLLVCAAELVTGWLLWHRRRGGAVLALALLPVEFAFWIGFALPLGPVLGLAPSGAGPAGLVAAKPAPGLAPFSWELCLNRFRFCLGIGEEVAAVALSREAAGQ